MSSNVSTNVTINGTGNDVTDFGFYLLNGIIGGVVWKASNWDGIWDADEKGLRGVNVSLYDEFDGLVRSVFSNETGNYTFDNLPYGKYRIKTGQNQEMRNYENLRIINVSHDPDRCEYWPVQLGISCYDHNGASVVIDKDDSLNTTIHFGYIRVC